MNENPHRLNVVMYVSSYVLPITCNLLLPIPVGSTCKVKFDEKMFCRTKRCPVTAIQSLGSFAKYSHFVLFHPSATRLTASLYAITAPIGLNDAEREAELQLGEQRCAIYKSFFEKTPDAAPSKQQGSSESIVMLSASQ